MEREVKFISGYNCIDFPCKFDKKCSPNNSHGKHGLDILFLLYGDKGCVQFKFSTGYVPFHTKPDSIRFREIPKNTCADLYPLPVDLGYHSYEPHYEGQTSTGKCDYLGGKDCYYDGSGLNANDAYYTLINGGEEELWKFLEKYYLCVFKDEEYPSVCEYIKEAL